MKKFNCVYFVLLFILLFISCDILRQSPFEVTAWTPGDGFHENKNLVVSLLLSHSSDRTKTEQAFSLNEDGRSIKGSFFWEGKRLFFTPSSPLEANHDYLITLGTGAQNEKGLSLENKFIASFTTRPPGARPRVVSTEPYDGIVFEPRSPLAIRFSETVNANSCNGNVSFTPQVSGSWRLEDDGKLALFYPLEPWKTGTRFRVTVNSGFSSVTGRSMGEDYDFFFTTLINRDSEKPELHSIWAVNENNEENEIAFVSLPDATMEVYDSWGSASKLKLEFSKPVDSTSVRSRLIIEPQISLIMETPPGLASTVIFRFAEKPAWQSRFLFKLNPGIRDANGNESEAVNYFGIRVNDPLSKPPSLAGMRIPLSPGRSDLIAQNAQIFTPDDLYADLNFVYDEVFFPYAMAIPFWLELYFDTAQGTGIDTFSLMNLFRVEATNHALTFSPRNIKDCDFTQPVPAEGWENFYRIEIQGYITNTVNSGVVTFRIAAGLEDNRGNRNAEVSRISLLK